MFKKIVIFGFPHCGTTILRNIISHIETVYEIVDETNQIHNNKEYNNYDFVLCKTPYLINESNLIKYYSNYIKIFIIRNPLYVFSSLNKRFGNNELDLNHSIEKYTNTIKEFNKFKNTKNIDNLFLIKYEDLFENNHKKLKYIFDKIGFNYNDEIFDNSKYINKVQHGGNLKVPKNIPPQDNNTAFRLYQINKKFENNNDINKIFLKEAQYQLLSTDMNILDTYPDIVNTKITYYS